MKVHSLIQQAVMRYKKAIAKVSGGYTLSSCGCFLFSLLCSCFPGNSVAAAAASRALCRRTQYGANLEIDAKRRGEKERLPRFLCRPLFRLHTFCVFVLARRCCMCASVFGPACCCCFQRNGGKRRTAIVVPLFVNPQKFLRLYNSQHPSFFPPPLVLFSFSFSFTRTVTL